MLNLNKLLAIIGIVAVIFIVNCSHTENPLSPQDPLSKEDEQGLSSAASSDYILSRTAENQLLSILARQIAELAGRNEIRNLITTEVIKSSQREGIISLESLLAKNITGKSVAELIQTQDKSNEINSLLAALPRSLNLMQIIQEHPLGIDVYFPVTTHRKLIEEGSDTRFLVMYYDGYLDDQVEQLIPVWDSNGNEISLTTKEPPDVPVLVMTQCEHEGKCRLGKNITQNNSLKKTLSAYCLFLNEYTIINDKEPWLSGDPEIYFTTQLYPNGYQRKNCYDFREGTYPVNPPRDLVYSASYPTHAKMEVWEDDPGTDDWLERWGGWYNDVWVWDIWMQINMNDWRLYYGDDHCANVKIRIGWVQ